MHRLISGAPSRAILRPRTVRACSISSFLCMVMNGDELHGAECSPLPHSMPLLLETIDPPSSLGERSRIRHARPALRLENPVSCIPQGDRRGTSLTLIPRPVYEGSFRNHAVRLPPMPTDQDILACSKCLGGTAHAPAALTEACGTFLHKKQNIPRPFVYNPDFYYALPPTLDFRPSARSTSTPSCQLPFSSSLQSSAFSLRACLIPLGHSAAYPI